MALTSRKPVAMLTEVAIAPWGGLGRAKVVNGIFSALWETKQHVEMIVTRVTPREEQARKPTQGPLCITVEGGAARRGGLHWPILALCCLGCQQSDLGLPPLCIVPYQSSCLLLGPHTTLPCPEQPERAISCLGSIPN